MVLGFLFNSQTHKSRDGYFINHDNIMVATPQERQRLIFYYIASQVPEKLNPTDRNTFLNLRNDELVNKSSYVGLFLGLRFAFTHSKRYIGTSLNPRIFLNGTFGVVGTLFWCWVGQNVTYTVAEPRFVTNNEALGQLAQQYNFTVYDFAQAKKEAHLKAMRRELTSDQLLTGY